MSEKKNCRNFIQMHTIIEIVATQSRARIMTNVMGLFPESGEVTRYKARLS